MKGNASNAYMQQGKLLPRRFQWNEGLDRPHGPLPSVFATLRRDRAEAEGEGGRGEGAHRHVAGPFLNPHCNYRFGDRRSTNFSFAVPSARILARCQYFGL